MKFVLFVEGYTEQKAVPSFLKRWLDPQLSQNVGIKPVRFQGWSEFQLKIARRARLHLNGPEAGQLVGAIGLLDLYGPDFFPGDLSHQERHERAVIHFQTQVDHPKFRMFFAVHEVEAWLLSDPQLLPAAVRSKLPGKAAQPESVNLSEPPAKLLDRLYRANTREGYDKVVHGSKLFDRLNPSVAYDKCPYLAKMLDEMLRMARQSGL